MTVKNISILFTIFLLLVVSISTAKDNIEKTSKFNSKEPIEITADRLDAYNEKKMAIFSGNAVVKQADWVLKTDRLTIFYRKEAGKKEKIGDKEIEATGDLEKIEAKGNVHVTQKMRVATSDEAVYFQDSGQRIAEDWEKSPAGKQRSSLLQKNPWVFSKSLLMERIYQMKLLKMLHCKMALQL